MAEQDYSQVVQVARDYYNSSDADRFYFRIWGGEDIHIGLYESDQQSIAEASIRTVRRMAELAGPLTPEMRVLDIGAGFGGAARFLARKHGCHVTALNLSEAQNRRDRQLCREQGLQDKVDVVDASFEEIPAGDASFDLVWSQDAILHSGERQKVIDEVARVLKPGGRFVMTDPMQADECPEGVLDPILARIHLETLASPGFYKEAAARAGLELVTFEEHTEQLITHYGRVLKETERRQEDLTDVSDEYISHMKKGLGHWIDGGSNDYLAWGIFVFRKPE